MGESKEKNTENGLCLEEIVDYAQKNNLKHRQLFFVNKKGQIFEVFDADKRLFGIPWGNGFSLLTDLDTRYGNTPAFSILQI